jgi:ABC-type uncharacterized transport system auxiliary subunit
MILEATENRDYSYSYVSNLVGSWAVKLLVCGMMSVACGCALTDPVVIHHSLTYPVPTRETKPPLPDTLMVYRFLMVPKEDGQSVVSPGSGDDRSLAPGDLWRENPADMITELLIRDLDGARLFERTVGQFSSMRYRYALEGSIRKFRGEIRDGKPLAVVEAELTLIDFDAPREEGRIALQKNYQVEVTCEDSSAEATVKGLKRAVRDLSTRLRRDIRSAFEKSDSDEPPERKRALSRSEKNGSMLLICRPDYINFYNCSLSIEGT